MSKLRVANFGLSVDGFGAGPNQSLERPGGEGGEAVHEWFFPTRTFQTMHGGVDGETGVDDDIAARGAQNVGAWIIGRNMFGPVRGPWPDDAWKGWWGEKPPFRTPVFVLTRHARAPIEMDGGTVFHFVTEGPEAARERAQDAAGGLDVRVGGGVATVRQYLTAGLIDELHLAVGGALLGRGECLLGGIDLPRLGYRVVDRVPTSRATHIFIRHEASIAKKGGL